MIQTNQLKASLEEIERQGLYRHLRELSGSQGSRVHYQGHEVVNFCSNNYLGLANDPRICEAAAQALKVSGFGSGASRLVCGHFKEHRYLEEKIAQMKAQERSLVFNSGYAANTGILSSLCGKDDIIFCDRLNHASIIDGILLSRCELKRYPHRDMQWLERELKKAKTYSKRVIVTDGVFSMDGDVAPLDEIVSLAKKYQAWVMVDDAHGFGVLGETGMGTAEHFHVTQDIDIQMGTLSKAVGTFGAYCCGSKELIDFLLNKARSFIYTTALPVCVAVASLKALEIMEQEPDRRRNLNKNAEQMRQGLKQMGFDALQSQIPIVPIIVHDSTLAVRCSEKLLEQGILVQAIRPPTVPKNTARLRVTIMATHTAEDIDRFLCGIKKVGKELCLI